MKRTAQSLLNDILLCAGKAGEIKSRTLTEDFSQTSNEGLAVCGCLSTMSLLIKVIPEEVKTKHPEVEWTQMQNFGDRLVERYWETDMTEVGAVVENQLPELQKRLQTILQELEK
jgi:uncharacterized protein with HEPN domain